MAHVAAVSPPKETLVHQVAVNGAVGAGAALAVVPLIMPFVHWKLQNQMGASFSGNPLKWYRGSVAFAGSFMTPTMIQVAVDGAARAHLERKYQRPLNEWEKVGVAMGAGVCSAFPIAALEALMINRQKEKMSYGQAFRELLRGKGMQPKVIALTIGRDIPFATTYLALVPIGKELLTDRGVGPAAAAISSGLFFGLLCATGTQPLDTLKTCFQGEKPLPETRRGLFRGLNGRVGMVIAAVTVLPVVKKELEQRFFPK